MTKDLNPGAASDLNASERSFIDALQRGVPWNKSFRDQYRSDHRTPDTASQSETEGSGDGDPPQPPTLDAELLRALIIVEGAAAKGLAPPSREAERCRKADLDPRVQLNIRGIEIESSEGDAPTVIRCTQIVDGSPVIDLRGVCFPKRLALQGCVFEGRDGAPANLLLDNAQISTIDLSRTRFQDLLSDQLRVAGDLLLEHVRVRSINLSGVNIGGNLKCIGSTFEGKNGIALLCNDANIERSVYLNDDFKAEGEVSFICARIGGQLGGIGGHFKAGETKIALHCNNAQIGMDVFLREGFQAEGEVNFIGARIGGEFDCGRGQFHAIGKGSSLECFGVQINESVFLNGGFKAKGRVNFSHARIGRDFSCWMGSFEAGEDGRALECENIQITDNVNLGTNFSAVGSVRFLNARIGGELNCDGGQFTAQFRLALDCSDSHISKGVFLRNNFRSKGEVCFLNARIDGLMNCGGGQFTAGESGPALNCNGVQIGNHVFMRTGFKADGEVRFVSASIQGQFSCRDGQFSAKNTDFALQCNGAQIENTVFLDKGFTSKGVVVFSYVRIGKNLNLDGCAISALADSEAAGGWKAKACVLDLNSVHIADHLFLPEPNGKKEAPPIEGSIDLRNAHCRILHDFRMPKTPNASGQWVAGWIKLDGLTYERLGERAPKLAKHRKRWLGRQPKADRRGRHFKPQPYEQVSKVLREMGHISSARSIAVTKQWRMHQSGNLHLSAYLFRWLALWPAGYGYRPQYPFLLGVALILVGAVIFETAYRTGYMSPAQPHAAIVEIGNDVRGMGRTREVTSEESNGTCQLVEQTEVVPPFNGIVYTLDTFVPLVDLDQESSWKPSQTRRCVEGLDQINPAPVWWTQNWMPDQVISNMVSWMPGWFVFAWKWGLMASGFVISTLIAASLSGLIRKD